MDNINKMDTTLIKLEVKKGASKGDDLLMIKKHFIRACEKLDASIFEPLIREEQYFQDLDKYRFLQSLKDEFDRVKKKEIATTTLVKGICEGCHLGEDTYQFYSGDETPEFSYIIHKDKKGDVQDIFKCNLSIGLNITKMQRFMGFEFNN